MELHNYAKAGNTDALVNVDLSQLSLDFSMMNLFMSAALAGTLASLKFLYNRLPTNEI